MKPLKFEDIIIHEDENLIIINKPEGIATLEDRSSPNNILKLARSYFKDASVCHRLDKETSGILALAKTTEAYTHFSKLLESRAVKKKYLAIVDGKCEEERFTCDKPLHTSGRGMAKVNHSKGKNSTTHFKRLFVGKKHSLLECEPLTGRFHQIRGHLSHLGMPITGDFMYGGESLLLSELKRNYNFSKEKEEQPIIRRIALHAELLSFSFNDEVYNFTATYPKDFKVAEKLIRQHV
ncbi:MAG: RluA family pseudouridine synthase [Bacteroidota bacterium]